MLLGLKGLLINCVEYIKTFFPKQIKHKQIDIPIAISIPVNGDVLILHSE